MSLDTTLSRVSQLEQLLAPPTPAPTAAPATAPTADSIAPGSFAEKLQLASEQTPIAAAFASPTSAPSGAVSGGTAGQRIVSVAAGEVGQAEYPPGSNDGPRIAVYRTAAAGAKPGDRWCVEFASWVARQAGVPMGDEGQGFTNVDDVRAWAQRTGRWLDGGERPQPGDLILFGSHHIGIVDTVNPDGSIETIEGNSSDRVSRRHREPGEATDFVRLG